MRILLIEDHEASAEALRRLLCKSPSVSAVEVAHTLADGLVKSQAMQPDITLLDLCLPDSTAYETLEAIPRFKPPVIVITDMLDPQLHADAFKAGAEDVLTKRTVFTLVNMLINSAIAANMRRLAHPNPANG